MQQWIQVLPTVLGQEAKVRLVDLIAFLKSEVEREEIIGLEMTGLGLGKTEDPRFSKKNKN